MFKYDMDAPIPAILARSELRNALMVEWPDLAATDINVLASEDDLAGAVAFCTGRTFIEAAKAVRHWMEGQGLPPVDDAAERLRDSGAQVWENEGGSSLPPVPY